MSINTARSLYSIFSHPAWMGLFLAGVLAFVKVFLIRGKKRIIPIVLCGLFFIVYLGTVGVRAVTTHIIIEQSGTLPVRVTRDTPDFSDKTMFSLRIYQPWFYESLHYTLQSDGTLIVQYYDTELGREVLPDEKMEEIRKIFSPEKVFSMDIGREDDRTDGTSRFIILYDDDENEIEIGGYELEGGDDFNDYFYDLYEMVQDDYTKQWSDKLDECMIDGVTYGQRYLYTDSKTIIFDIEKVIDDEQFQDILLGRVKPQAVFYGIGGESGYASSSTEDPELIEYFIEAFRELTVTEAEDGDTSYTADGGEVIIFATEDIEQIEIELDGGIRIHSDSGIYELGNTLKLSEACAIMQEMAYINAAGGIPSDGYIIKFQGGSGELSYETYVYETDYGYKYINIDSKTTSWGSAEWEHTVEKIGYVSDTEELLDAAIEHGADSIYFETGDDTPYPISDFL